MGAIVPRGQLGERPEMIDQLEQRLRAVDEQAKREGNLRPFPKTKIEQDEERRLDKGRKMG
jgi:hypothetical protein